MAQSSYSVATYESGLALEDKIVFPVMLRAAYSYDGWSATAKNKREFRKLLKTGLDLSPISEVLIKHKREPK